MNPELQILISIITVFVLAAYAQINAERSDIPGVSAGVAYGYLSKHLKNLSAQINNFSALAFALSSFGLAEIIMPKNWRGGWG